MGYIMVMMIYMFYIRWLELHNYYYILLWVVEDLIIVVIIGIIPILWYDIDWYLVFCNFTNYSVSSIYPHNTWLYSKVLRYRMFHLLSYRPTSNLFNNSVLVWPPKAFQIEDIL